MTTESKSRSKRTTDKKPLRIRPELLPDSAKYGSFDGEEYVMIPVKDFGGWFEDIEDMLAAEEYRNNPEPGIPFDDVLRDVELSRKTKQ